MSSIITSDQWTNFIATQKTASDTFANETITLKKLMYNMDDWQEDPESTSDSLYTTFNLPCLINYNYYRVWGVNQSKQEGEKQGESMAVIFNKQVLIDTNPSIIDANGNLIFDSATDFFIHRGIRYTSQGDTFLSQSNDSPILFMLILQRDKKYTGENKGTQT